MNKTVTVHIKGKDEVIELDQGPKPLAKGDAKATAKSVKVTLVLEPGSITEVDSIGQKQTKLLVTSGNMKFEALLNSKTYRKALATLAEQGADNCQAILQGSMSTLWKLESAGLVIQPKIIKQDNEESPISD